MNIEARTAPVDPPPQRGGGGPCEAWWRGCVRTSSTPPPSPLRGDTSPVSRGRNPAGPFAQTAGAASRPEASAGHSSSSRGSGRAATAFVQAGSVAVSLCASAGYPSPERGGGTARSAVGGVHLRRAARNRKGTQDSPDRGMRNPGRTPPTMLRMVPPPRSGEGGSPASPFAQIAGAVPCPDASAGCLPPEWEGRRAATAFVQAGSAAVSLRASAGYPSPERGGGTALSAVGGVPLHQAKR